MFANIARVGNDRGNDGERRRGILDQGGEHGGIVRRAGYRPARGRGPRVRSSSVSDNVSEPCVVMPAAGKAPRRRPRARKAQVPRENLAAGQSWALGPPYSLTTFTLTSTALLSSPGKRANFGAPTGNFGCRTTPTLPLVAAWR